MPTLNEKKNEVFAMRKKILKSLQNLISKAQELSNEMNGRFREEYEVNGELEGLEDFYMLTHGLKRNLQAAKNAYALLNRTQDLTGYDISEETEDEKELAEILDNKAKG